jgi:hypothetical protein
MNLTKNWKPLHQGNVLVYQWKGPEADRDRFDEFPYFVAEEIGYSMLDLKSLINANSGRMNIAIAGNGATVFQRDPYIGTFIRGIEWEDPHKITTVGTDLGAILAHRDSIRKGVLLVPQPIIGQELQEIDRDLLLREHMLTRIARESSSKEQFMANIQKERYPCH